MCWGILPKSNEIPLLGCTTPWVLHEASQPIAMGSNHIAGINYVPFEGIKHNISAF